MRLIHFKSDGMKHEVTDADGNVMGGVTRVQLAPFSCGAIAEAVVDVMVTVDARVPNPDVRWVVAFLPSEKVDGRMIPMMGDVIEFPNCAKFMLVPLK